MFFNWIDFNPIKKMEKKSSIKNHLKKERLEELKLELERKFYF